MQVNGPPPASHRRTKEHMGSLSEYSATRGPLPMRQRSGGDPDGGGAQKPCKAESDSRDAIHPRKNYRRPAEHAFQDLALHRSSHQESKTDWDAPPPLHGPSATTTLPMGKRTLRNAVGRVSHSAWRWALKASGVSHRRDTAMRSSSASLSSPIQSEMYSSRMAHSSEEKGSLSRRARTTGGAGPQGAGNHMAAPKSTTNPTQIHHNSSPDRPHIDPKINPAASSPDRPLLDLDRLQIDLNDLQLTWTRPPYRPVDL